MERFDTPPFFMAFFLRRKNGKRTLFFRPSKLLVAQNERKAILAAPYNNDLCIWRIS